MTARHLRVEDLVRVRGTRTVLNGVTLTVSAGERLGLIGENGVGKSTLLATLAGVEPPDSGTVHVALDEAEIGYLPQEPSFPADWTLAEALAHARRGVDRLADRMRELEQSMATADGAELSALTDEYGQVQEEFADRGGWHFEARVAEVLDVLGLGGLPTDRPVDRFSGGERARLALAVLLLGEPGALLLDEPTNHLDDDAVDWLGRWIAGFRGPCVIASHDRDLLDTAVTGIVDLDGPRGSVTLHGGGYGDYLSTQRAARRRWEQAHRDWLAACADAATRLAGADRGATDYRPRRDNAKMNYDMRGAGAQAAVARNVRSARAEIDRLHRDPVPAPPPPLRFGPAAVTGAGPDNAGPDGAALLVAEPCRTDTGIELPGLTLAGRDRIVVVGPNGSGKSTFLRLLAGVETAARGTVWRRPGARVGLLRQDSVVDDPSRLLRSAYARATGTAEDDAGDTLLALGLFRPADLDVAVGSLSSGQRRRLDLAVLVTGRPDVLLLDEPTNHLSLALVADLEAAIEQFAGPVVMVTHDRRFRATAGITISL